MLGVVFNLPRPRRFDGESGAGVNILVDIGKRENIDIYSTLTATNVEREGEWYVRA